MTLIYRYEARQVGKLAFSMWNRDPGSPSYGSFDRMYWGWKYKDFSDSTMQYAVRLAVEYARETGQTATLPELLEQFTRYCGSIQHADGSFDQCYPYEKSSGVFYDFLSTLIYVRTSPLLESDVARSALDDSMARGVTFQLKTDESHGRVANHIAQYAFELINYAAYSGDDRARRRGEAYVERTLSWFDRDEGWFLEYHGADTGYQTRTMRYLAKIAELTKNESLWQTIAKAARFVEQTLMPDGSVHPMLGCRSTALLYPSAFEMLAARDERFHSLGGRVRGAWDRKRVPLPSGLDFGNAIRLGDDALDAALVCWERLGTAADEALSPFVRFDRAGIVVRRTATTVTYVSASMGGTVVVCRRSASGDWRIAHEDSGYLIKSVDGAARWLTRMPEAGQLLRSDTDQLVVEANFYRSLHDEMTPMRMIALRLLNMTVLRVGWLGDLFRKLVVGRLIGNRTSLAVRLVRQITFQGEIVRISDRVSAEGPLGKARNGALYRCRKVTGIHMASARYFQEQELEDTGMPWVARVADNVDSEYAHITESGPTPGG